jgi:hypothetical protein
MSCLISLCVLHSRFNASYLGHTLSRDSVRVWIEGGGPAPLYAAYFPKGSGNPMPYFGAAASVRSISSGPSGGALPPSCAGRPASKKKFSIPAGVNNTSILAGVAPTFLKRCKVPLAMWTNEPALAMKVRSPSWISNSPSST